jgi:excinuclease UvrABC helicase subunit UvrB
MSAQELTKKINDLTQEMHESAEQLNFEKAAKIRDEIAVLKEYLLK